MKIALLGFGVVGSGTAEVLMENMPLIERRCGEKIEVKYILDLREFPNHPLGNRVVHDIAPILADPEVRAVAEMLGGAHPAYEFTKSALQAGKSVVTSNKEVVAKFGVELLKLAAENGVRYLFEASVGGGIPILRPLREDLAPNQIISVSGILNGTTNYIFTKMESENATFGEALRQAQSLGYAEANPAADVEGTDAARKIVILSALAFGKLLSPEKISVQGISNITREQTEVAAKLGCAVKLIGHTEKTNGRILALVSPHAVPMENPIAHVREVNNGILVNANMVGKTFFYGAGAGKLPTASAIVSDILSVVDGGTRLPQWQTARESDYANPKERVCRRIFCLSGCAKCAEKTKAYFGYEEYLTTEKGFAFVSQPINEEEAQKALQAAGKDLLWTLPVLD